VCSSDLPVHIIIEKQIGSVSKYGVVYLAHFYKSYGKFAVKIAASSKDNIKEYKILKQLSNYASLNKNPHFPITYGLTNCPKIEGGVKERKKNQLATFNELADGDVKMIVYNPDFHNNFDLIKNAIQQIYISILSFHLYTGKIHKDAHWGNFLFHKIKAGGYFHYNIYGVDIYLKNLGYLWVIWDFGMAEKQTYDNSYRDYDRVIYAFVNNTPKTRYGWIETKDFVYPNELVTLVESVFDSIRTLDKEKSLWTDKLLKSLLFSNELSKPPNNEILNLGNPYILK
jgi:serine/threonine protein kinase